MMKVTVCFGNIRVIVPCGNGDLLVTELIEKAIFRYKKAINKPLDYWVRVHSLKSLSDGGILDFDDRLSDVTDDREQLIAIYEEQDAPSVPHNGGDGTSASSSAGTSSPDLFQPELLNNNNEKNLHHQGVPPGAAYMRRHGKNDVIITHNDLSMGSSLIVRRGSEPALNNLGTSGVGGGAKPPHSLSQSQSEKPARSFAAANKRWSAIASIDETKGSRSAGDSAGSDSGGSEQDLPPPFQRLAGSGSRGSGSAALSRFARDSARQSLASNNSAVFRWMEAQQRAEEEADSFQLSRADPVGGSGHGDDDSYGSPGSPHSPEGFSWQDSYSLNETQVFVDSVLENRTLRNSYSASLRLQGEILEMVNEGGPLGIHVVPEYDESGREVGLVIQGIEAGGRIYRDGRLRVQDRITEINGTSLDDVEFNKAQEVFKQALQTDRIRLRVIRAAAPPLPKQPPPLLPKKPSNLDLSQNTAQPSSSPIKLEDLNPPANEVPPVPPARHPSTTLSAGSPGTPPPTSPPRRQPPPIPGARSDGKPKLVAPTNTRKIGKKISINLTKGPEGLGFSVTTRDNPAGGNAPIYIKNILPKGAAVKDGRLKSGDRLLEVNGVEMTGKSQTEAVSVLRNTKLGSTVAIVVSRQVTEEDDQFAVPRELPRERAGVPPDDSVFSSTAGREVLQLDIPLNDTGSAGLGVSVKGKTSTTDRGTSDLGIFIKSVITGGAASKDGRLFVNDQLLEVNGVNLSVKSNSDAMEALRLAMQQRGSGEGGGAGAPRPGFIRVVVGRRPGLAPSTPGSDAPASPEDGSAELRISVSDSAGLPPSAAGGDAAPSGATKTQSAAASDTLTPARNPVLDRVAGVSSGSGDAGGGIRNLSYMRATHDSMLESFATEPGSPQSKQDSNDTPTSAFTNVPKKPLTSTPASTSVLNSFGSSAQLTSSEITTGDVIQIDETTTYQRGTVPTGGKLRPASTIGFSQSAMDVTTSSRAGAAPGSQAAGSGAPQPPDWLVEWDKQRNSSSSELSPTDQQIPFARDALGRQSMSEKRHGHLDPRISEFYKKLKEARGQPYSSATWERKKSASVREDGSAMRRAGSAESLLSATNNSHHLAHDPRDLHVINKFYFADKRNSNDVGPTLGLKKSSSLESLQTAVQDATLDDGEANQLRSAPNRGMVRGRGCNDSFRAAVDRSYDDPNNEAETMETPGRARKIAVEEESSETGSTSAKGSIRAAVPAAAPGMADSAADTRSSKSSVASDASQAQQPAELEEDRKGGKKKGSKKDKDKGSGIFKGLGHMFRFGKHRGKGEEEGGESRHSSRERSADSRAASRERPGSQAGGDGRGKESKAKRVAREEHEKIQEQYRKLQEKQQELDRGADAGRRSSPSPAGRPASPAGRPASPAGAAPALGPPPSRAERIQQLRTEHQRRHRERQGQYPSERQDELYEQRLQQLEQQRAATIEGYYSTGSGGAGDFPRRPSAPPGAEAYDSDDGRVPGYASSHYLWRYYTYSDSQQRPGSRLGYADPGPHHHGYHPADLDRYGDGRFGSSSHEDRYSHYQNLQEIQAQLARHEYYQQRYQQYLAAQAHAHHQQMAAMSQSARAPPHPHAHHHGSLSASQLLGPPPLPPRQPSDFHPHLSQRNYGERGYPDHRAYPATEPRGNWNDLRHHHMLAVPSTQPRSLTPSLPHEATSTGRASPRPGGGSGRLLSRPPGRSSSPAARGSSSTSALQTPLSQVSYLPPHLPPLHASQHSYSLDFMAYDDQRLAASQQRQGAYGADSSSAQFGSLPRRAAGRSQSSTVSEAARV